MDESYLVGDGKKCAHKRPPTHTLWWSVFVCVCVFESDRRKLKEARAADLSSIYLDARFIHWTLVVTAQCVIPIPSVCRLVGLHLAGCNPRG